MEADVLNAIRSGQSDDLVEEKVSLCHNGVALHHQTIAYVARIAKSEARPWDLLVDCYVLQ